MEIFRSITTHQYKISCYRPLVQDPIFAGVLHNRGNALQSLGRHDDAAETFRLLLEVAPGFDFALGLCFHSRRQGYDWRDFEHFTELIRTGIIAGRRVDRPFSFLSVADSAAQQSRCAQIYAAQLCPTAPAPLWRRERYDHQRIRVAYVSADFRDHVVARFMAPLYERHDRQRFEVTGVALAAQDDSDIIARNKASLDQFIDASASSDQDLARRLRDLEIDVAVDLTGFTQGCRPGVFARPVQVNFLGFPASMGVPWMDYIVADDFVVPPASEHLYAEKIARLPHCFQPNDPRGLWAEESPAQTRASVGLPDEGTVLCAFSNHYKLNPTIFAVWMRVLSAAPGSVLWLLGGSARAQQRLCQEAAGHGIAPERLIFAACVSYAQHLARLRLADLFLDTLPFNAGATASDALRAGVPLLTCTGESFAARMAGSLLRSIGMPEMITGTLAEYEGRATALAVDRALLQRLRQRLADNLGSAPLFDGAHYCRHLEAAYSHMLERAQRGEAPASFTVAADQV